MNYKQLLSLGLIFLGLISFGLDLAFSRDFEAYRRFFVNQSEPVYIYKDSIPYMLLMPGDILSIEFVVENPLGRQLSYRANGGAWSNKERLTFKVDEKFLAEKEAIDIEVKDETGELDKSVLYMSSPHFQAPKIERIEINGTYTKSASASTHINELDLMPGQFVDLNVVAKDPKDLDLEYAFEGLVDQNWQSSSRLRFVVTEEMLKSRKPLLVKIKNSDLKLHQSEYLADDSKELKVTTKFFQSSRIEFLDVYIDGEFIERVNRTGKSFEVAPGQVIKMLVTANDPQARLIQFRFNAEAWGDNEVYLKEIRADYFESIKIDVKNDDGYAYDIDGADERWYVNFVPKYQVRRKEGEEKRKQAVKKMLVFGGGDFDSSSARPVTHISNLDESIYTFLNRRIVFLSDLDRLKMYTQSKELHKKLIKIADNDSIDKIEDEIRQMLKRYKRFGEELLDSAKAYDQARKKLKAALTQMQTHLKEKPNLASKSLVKELEGYAKQLNLKGKFTAKDMKKAKELKETYREIMNDFEKSCLPGEELPLPKERSESKSI